MSNTSNNDIATSIYEAFSGRSTGDFEDVSKKVVHFLHRRRLLYKYKDILWEIEKVMNNEAGVLKAKVYGKRVLTQEAKRNLSEFLKNNYQKKEVILEEYQNDSWLGGVRVEVEDEVIDMTVKSNLQKLKEHLIKSA